MAKPAVTLRNTKGSHLTFTELDTNFTNLKDATVTLTAGTGGTAVTADLNGTITLVAGTNITLTGNNTAKTITIAASGGSGGISNVVEDTTPQLGGDLDVNGYKIVSTSNGHITVQPNGTGDIYLRSDTVYLGDGPGDSEIMVDGRAAIFAMGSSLGGSKTYGGSMIINQSNTTGEISINAEPAASAVIKLQNNYIRVGGGSISSGYVESINGQHLVLRSAQGDATYTTSITLDQAVNGNVTVTPNGTGKIHLDGAVKTNATTGTPTTYENGYYEDMLMTPVSWLKINIGGSDYYLPLYQ